MEIHGGWEDVLYLHKETDRQINIGKIVELLVRRLHMSYGSFNKSTKNPYE